MSVWTHDEPDEQIVEVGDLVVIVPPLRTIYIPHESDRDMQRACAKTGKWWRVATQAGDIKRPMVME